MEHSKRWESAKERVLAVRPSSPAIVAMDLDGTLFPERSAPDDGALSRLIDAIKCHELIDVWASGRRRTSACRKAAELNIPLPEFFIAELGPTLLRKSARGELIEEPAWPRHFQDSLQDWNRDRVKSALRHTPLLEFQEKRPSSPFKLGYRFEPEMRSEAVRAATELAREASKDALVVTTIDIERNIGFVDIVPFCADKRAALEWLRQELGIPPRRVAYAGNGGNDIPALTAGWLGIVVKNASPEVKGKVTSLAREKDLEDRIHHASGIEDLNGNFASGIIEGLIAHGIIDPHVASNPRRRDPEI